MNKRTVSVAAAALMMMSSAAAITAYADEPGKTPETIQTVTFDSGDLSNFVGAKSPNTGVSTTPGSLPAIFASLAAVCALAGMKKTDEDDQ